jgi:hypothetical protein
MESANDSETFVLICLHMKLLFTQVDSAPSPTFYSIIQATVNFAMEDPKITRMNITGALEINYLPLAEKDNTRNFPLHTFLHIIPLLWLQ